MVPPIDLDTIKYPFDDPTVILSVSDSFYEEDTHVDKSQYLYVEKYALAKYLSAEAPPGPHGHTRFHLFTNELALGNSKVPLGFGVPGGTGTAGNPNGGSGGEIVLCVEDTMMLNKEALENFKLDVSGGDGYSPTHVPGQSTGQAGGNGGNGGHAQIWLGRGMQKEQEEPILQMRKWVDNIHTRVEAKSKSCKWPDDFKNDSSFMENLTALVGHSRDKPVAQVYTLAWTTTEKAFAVKFEDFKKTLAEMHILLKPTTVTKDEDDKLRLLEKSIVWQGGKYGKGTHGNLVDGKNGENGMDGLPSAKWLNVPEMLKSKTCFAHPAQCQMLLDKANVLYFFGTSRSIAKSKVILQSLETRLLFLGGAQDNIADSALAHGYKAAEKRLFIHAAAPISSESDPDWKKKQNEEPASVRQLRAIRDEASRMRQQIDSRFDFYGADGDVIPNLSFEVYQESLKEFIEHAAKVEDSYSEYQRRSNDKIQKEAALRSASDATAKRKTANDYYYESARKVAEVNATKIEYLVDPLEKGRQALEVEVESVQQLIKKAFKVSLKDAVSAIGQVLFMSSKAAPLMAGLQATDLFEDASTKIENDLGEKLKKSYIIKKIKRITSPTLQGLFEQFSTSADGKVTLKEGDTTKLAMAEEDLDTLVDSISDQLNGDSTGSGAKAKFEKYISLIKERNNAVVQYNAALALMRKCEKDRNTIDAANKGISKQRQNLDSEDPLLVLFMKRLYTDALTDTQLMLNRAQKALNFEFLGNFNAFDNLSDYPSSRSSANLLGAAKEELSKEYIRLKDEHRSRQSFTNIKYPLDEIDIDGLEPGPTGNIKLFVQIKRKTGGPFEGKADVRLTKVRFFVEGATTDSNQLNITLTHDTTETIYDESGTPHRFSHTKQIISFSHHTNTKEIGDSDGTVGEKQEKDGYALVGPFTGWWIDIRKSNNKGLKGGIAKAWFEFDGEARPVVAS